MNEPRAFASLSSGLLARKGAAKPAMRPQGFGQMGASLEDLGWNDMGFEAPKPTIAPQARDADHDAFGNAVAEQPIRNPVSALTRSPTVSAPATPLQVAATSPVHHQQADLEQQFVAERLSDAAEQDHPEVPASEEHLAPVVAALPEPVLTQPVETAAAVKPRIVAVQTAVSPRSRVANGTGPKAAFTLRLDAQRHLKLRLACALKGRSAQMMVTEAVDRLLSTFPELDTLAAQLPEGSLPRRAQG
ncbi:MAG TPA: hypothetical protein VEZ48_03130 [Sphingomonadaceae bacterium]|nr:hypothetical protein [Sphingomonadaceae bacterium]